MLKGLALAVAVLAAGCVTSGAGSDDPAGSIPSSGGSDPTGGSPSTSYRWVAGTYGACSLPCGGGVQARSIACVASDGSPAADSDCTEPKPDAQQACNAQSCSNTNCTPTFHFGNAEQFDPTSPSTGAGPLTVSFDMTALTYFNWDHIDFGDGTTFPGDNLTFVNTSANDGNGNDESTNACIVHTFIAPGTYNVGRDLTGYDTVVEATVTVQ